MRKIELIVIHCSATRVDRRLPVDALERSHRARGFNGIGYHYYITRDGVTHPCRAEERVGAHALGYNARSIGICYEGGLDKDGQPADTRTALQRASMEALVRSLLADYPHAEVLGHCDLPGVQKSCPCFNVKEWIQECGIPQ